jgi:uncharacterized protein YlxP (DUF503 family)
VVIGVIGWDLEVFGCQSLKEKRRVVKSLRDRLRDRHNISVAETGHQYLWQRTELTACAVGTDRRQVEAVLGAADRLVAGEARVRIIDTVRSFL